MIAVAEGRLGLGIGKNSNGMVEEMGGDGWRLLSLYAGVPGAQVRYVSIRRTVICDPSLN